MAVVLVFVAIAGALTHQAITRARAVDRTRTQLAELDAAAAEADRALIDLAASERGYVAPGQGLDFWSAKVDEALVLARNALGVLRISTGDETATARIASALSRLNDLTAMDARARELVRGGQRLMASDTIFADGYEIIAATRADAAAAASAERSAAAAPLARDRQLHLAAVGALAVCAGGALLLLLRAPKPAEPLVTSLGEPLFDAASARRQTAALDEDAIGAALDASLATLAEYEPGTEAPEAPVLPASPAVDLSAAADACVDLARLLDAQDLQALLGRIATILGAQGLIVWVADPSGSLLAPALTHGYEPSLIARLGSLSKDADNATAQAWRSKGTQVVAGGAGGPGALAVPLLTSDGCMGVLSVELRQGRERASDVQALARIVAAQLAAVVTAPAAEAQKAAEA